MEKLLKQILLALGPVLIGLGIFKFTLYYSFFNVPITKFLDVSEIIVLFANDIILYCLLTALSALVSFWAFKRHKNYKYKRILVRYLTETKFFKRVGRFWGDNPHWAVSLIVFSILSSLIDHYKLNAYTAIRYLWYLQIIRMAVVIIFLETKRKINTTFGLREKYLKYEIIFSYFMSLIFTITTYTLIEIQNVKYNYKYINTFMLIDEAPYQSDSNSYYIGSTNRYVFLYDVNQDNTTIIPMSRIKLMTFGANKHTSSSTRAKN